jgi:hypothetical protein
MRTQLAFILNRPDFVHLNQPETFISLARLHLGTIELPKVTSTHGHMVLVQFLNKNNTTGQMQVLISITQVSLVAPAWLQVVL